jgi:hypothetical protein
LAWFVFIVAAFALPATAVRVHAWLSKKNGLPSQSAVAKNQSASKSRALAVTDAELSR